MTTPQSILVPDFAQEQWRPAPGREGLYDVSDQGRVRRAVAGLGTEAGRIRRLVVHATGYCTVSLGDERNRKETYLIHRLVAAAFIGPIPDGYCINHIDADRANNHACNLEIVTIAENNRHTLRLGRHSVGEVHVEAKLTAEQVGEIRALSRGGASQIALAERFGVGDGCIQSIVSGKTWKQLPDDGRVLHDPSLRPTYTGHRGLSNPRAKLHEQDIPAIRRRYADGEPTRDIAEAYGVSRFTIKGVVRGKSWRHVP